MDTLVATPWLKNVGKVGQLTRGSALQWPWFENSAPPFDRICEVCDAPELIPIELLPEERIPTQTTR